MSRPFVVLKFGGSSLATVDRIRNVAVRVKNDYLDRGLKVSVVVSAMGKTTDGLIDLAQRTSNVLNGRELDQLLVTGEQQSAALLAMAIEELGFRVKSFNGAQAGISATGYHMEGRIADVNPERVLSWLEGEGEVAVVTGFQGINEAGDFVTLGRGGSDLSAVALAVALKSSFCHIYTDVDGVYTADPKIVSTARKLTYISYEECIEMAALGAKVLQARSVEFASLYDMPIYVSSSILEGEGTWVKEKTIKEGLAIKAVVHDKNIAKIAVLGVPDVPGIAAGLFSKLADRGVGVEMIIQSVMRGDVNDIAFLVKETLLGEAIEVCGDYAREIDAQGVTYDAEVGRVSIVGVGLSLHPEIPAEMFSVLSGEGINIDMISSTSNSITCVISSSMIDRAVSALHRHFLEGEK
ncbi:aspartate kinase [Acetomicrobium thermoterrenum DSM 13490]|uniref:Aspartokinase n=1 Tax=Acetomicrobium thermoterrenum DSM 13490 TaxID=1120987 RepID=A0A1H3DAY8_9BACT|nr:aspartate kinase [Acetomicrobium thermoterrenum]SDX63571.1 aspartate kinase [Acetomicrobium thermoterrenum DSM 13490]